MKHSAVTDLFIAMAIATGLTVAAHAGGSVGHTHEEAIVHGHDESKTHDHGASHDHGQLAIGVPGHKEKVSRTITVTMRETDDGSMVFEPGALAVSKGETIRFAFKNEGDAEHEFVMDTHKGILDHKVAMEKWPNMEHADPNSIRLESGETGEIIWTFNRGGEFQFACLIPGHFDAGMHGKLSVKTTKI